MSYAKTTGVFFWWRDMRVSAVIKTFKQLQLGSRHTRGERRNEENELARRREQRKRDSDWE